MQGVAKNIGSVTKSLESAMASLDLEKISKIMEKFEAQFTDLDVKAGVLEGMREEILLKHPLIVGDYFCSKLKKNERAVNNIILKRLSI